MLNTIINQEFIAVFILQVSSQNAYLFSKTLITEQMAP